MKTEVAVPMARSAIDTLRQITFHCEALHKFFPQLEKMTEELILMQAHIDAPLLENHFAACDNNVVKKVKVIRERYNCSLGFAKRVAVALGLYPAKL